MKRKRPVPYVDLYEGGLYKHEMTKELSDLMWKYEDVFEENADGMYEVMINIKSCKQMTDSVRTCLEKNIKMEDLYVKEVEEMLKFPFPWTM
ncbi:MAG: hypothetical protein ACK5L6_10155 [Anaerorhabdus sp.]|uniref:hypothetical protein n=1 Tax=Anaerorhabdus sp. TaxID=1872524 RepID=UPI003A8732A0